MPGWVLGFHGTDEDTVQKVLTNPKEHLEPSRNGWDWLGDGVYFWENDPVRAEAFAYERMTFRKVHGKKVAVIGAIIDLGLCLNMFEQDALRELHAAHEDLVADFAVLGEAMPENKGKSEDLVLRYLDQAVFTHLHSMRKRLASVSPYQTVRSGFHEGERLFPNTSFRQKNHIQIAVRDLSCIKGYFLPREPSRAIPAAGA